MAVSRYSSITEQMKKCIQARSGVYANLKRHISPILLCQNGIDSSVNLTPFPSPAEWEVGSALPAAAA